MRSLLLPSLARQPLLRQRERKGLVKRVALARPRGMQSRCALPPLSDIKQTSLQRALANSFESFSYLIYIVAQIAVVLHCQFKPVSVLQINNYIPLPFTCHMIAILQSDWPRSIFNVGTRNCDPFDQTLSLSLA